MNPFVVLYREPHMALLDVPFAFTCSADDSDHAEEQCMDAYPDCEILWVVDTDDPHKAYDDYWNILPEN